MAEKTETKNRENKQDKKEKRVETIPKSKENFKDKLESTIKEAKSSIKPQKKTEEKKVQLERTYVVPLRSGFLKVPRYKRSKKALKTLKEFLAKHMRVENRDLSKVKIDIYLNNEIWFRGIRKPLHKVKVKAKKIDGIVYAELADIPEAVKWKIQKDNKKKNKLDKKALEKVKKSEEAEEEIKEAREDSSDKKEDEEKKKATVEAGLKKQEAVAKEMKHTTQAKSSKIDKMSATTQRKALKK